MKKTIAFMFALAMIFALCACGSKTVEEAPSPASTEKKIGLANPYHETDQDGILQSLGFDFQVPAGAEDEAFYTIDTDPQIAQMTFVFDGDEYIYRMSATSEFKDISGMYYTWENNETAQIDYNEAQVSWNDWKEGVILWYDEAPGIMYSLSQKTNANFNSLEGMAINLYQPTQGDVDGDDSGSVSDEFVEVFNGLLADFQQNYYPATAGSQLKAAQFAAHFMDLFTEDEPQTSDVSDLTKAFVEGLDASAAEEFKTQISDLQSAADSLNNGEAGKMLLENSGYDAQNYPWEAKKMAKLFDAMNVK